MITALISQPGLPEVLSCAENVAVSIQHPEGTHSSPSPQVSPGSLRDELAAGLSQAVHALPSPFHGFVSPDFIKGFQSLTVVV